MKLEHYNKVVVRTCEEYLSKPNISDNERESVLNFLLSWSPQVFETDREAQDLIHNLPKEIMEKLDYYGVYLFYPIKYTRYEGTDEKFENMVKNVEASLSS